MDIVRTKKAYKTICILVAFVGATLLNTSSGVNPGLGNIQSPDTVGHEACTSQKCLEDMAYEFPFPKDIISHHAMIGMLESLRKLNLSGNKLETLPPKIGNLKLLEILDLRNNEFETLPPEIGNLKELFWLYLGNNKLETLPPKIEKLKYLRELDLKDNN
ncbi:uncharacterized protein VICG_02194, partial [Vittaforma corneae ATCC 50505]